MSISEKIHEDVAILTISGKLMGGDETKAITIKVNSLLDDGMRNIVMDLGKVKWMNSTGLGALLESRKMIIDNKGTLKLAAVADKIKSLLMITQILSQFETFETADRAIASFKN